MKNKLALFLGALILSLSASSQNCCTLSKKKDATDMFASLGTDPSFTSSHLQPEPLINFSASGKMVSFKTPDGKTANAYQTGNSKSRNWIFVFHEWWGLNDHIKKEADRLSAFCDVNVLALDLYDGKVTANSDSAGALMGKADKERIALIIKGAAEYSGDVKITTIGWCFGGGWALQASIILGNKNNGTVMYYGMPEKDPARLKMLNAPVLGLFAGKDKWITPEIVKEFEASMKKLDKKIEVKTFDADHAFANPSNPHFDEKNAEQANKSAEAFIKSRSCNK